MAVSENDRRILRDLAKRLAEHAAQPRNAKLAELWRRHNRLEKTKPLVLVSPEGAWNEILPVESMEAEDPQWQRLERELRMRIYHAEHFKDDKVVDDVVKVGLVCNRSGWGVEVKHTPSPEHRGAWAFAPVLKEPEDIKKLHFPGLTVDEAATQRDFEEVQELLGDILTVRVSRRGGGYNPLSFLVNLRGLSQLMLDMCDRPEWVHEVMSFLTEGQSRLFDQAEALGAVELNNGSNGVGSGGLGFSDELPAEGYQGRPRLRDCWGFSEAQEFSQVSPAMLEEFVLPYQARLAERFGLNCYGCCESLTHKLGGIKKWIPRLRRISISPWTDIRVAAEELQDKYIYSWKPNPSEMIITFDPAHIRRSVAETLEVAKDCVLEIILKDIHTVQGEPQRLATWVDIAQELTAEKCAA